MQVVFITVFVIISTMHEMLHSHPRSESSALNIVKKILFETVGGRTNEAGYSGRSIGSALTFQKVCRRLIESEKWNFSRENQFYETESFKNLYDYCSGCIGTRSKSRPSSVHALRPGDIDVIAALGDSATAANGAMAKTIFQVAIENRGVAWSIGGQGTWKDYLTLPNILKEFNPRLIGYSLNDGISVDKSSQFNVAEPAAVSEDLPFMARELVHRMSNDRRVDMKKDWKLVTVMMGFNDFCTYICYVRNSSRMLEKHFEELHEALTIIKNNIPRVLINLVPAPDISMLIDFKEKPSVCRITHMIFCSCFQGEAHKQMLDTLMEIMSKWRKIDADMAELPEFNDSDDFSIVIQPFSANLSLLVHRHDSHLSYDCLHFSVKGHATMAVGLWNNMFEPVGNKSHALTDHILCPSNENPYIFTNKNSFPNRRHRCRPNCT